MLEASRGCRFNCTFCAQGPHSKWDPVPVDRVITNIEFLLSRGVHELEFVDNEFFGGRNDALIARASQITNAIRKLSEKYGVKAAFRIFTNPLIIAKADEQQAGTNQKMKELLHYMKNCGLKRLYIGIEAASEEQRKRFNRKDTIQDVILAIQVVRELEIALDAGFIMFDPLMNLQDIKENVNFYKTYNLLEANTWPHRDLCVLFDTPMLHLLKKKGLITGVDYYELVYTYQYASQDMAYFANTVLEFGAKTGKLFQVLKYSTKELFNEQLKHQALLFSRKMVDENAKIFLELMDNMVQCLEQGSRDYGKCLESAWRAMVNLIKEIEKSLVIYDTNSAHYPKLVKNLDEAKKQLGMSNLEQIS
nr:radical SAM protein [Dendrosporobacter quercicolus]